MSCLHPGCNKSDVVACPQCGGDFCLDHIIVDDAPHAVETHWELDSWDGYGQSISHDEGSESLFDSYEDFNDDE